MDKSDRYLLAAVDMVTEVREQVLLLTIELGAGPPSDKAVQIAGVLGSLRRPLAALELNVETLLAARQAGSDETWRRVAEKFYAAGLRAAEASGDTAPVVPLRAMASA